MSTRFRTRTGRVIIAAITLILLATPVPARADGGCFAQMAGCFEATASIVSFWYRTWEALDCELGFIGCVRTSVLGR